MAGFRYGMFGLGFQLTYEIGALKFGAYIATRGEEITVIEQILDGYDDYNDPIYTENSYVLKVFMQPEGRERVLQIGDLKVQTMKMFFQKWAPIEEELYELEYLGVRWHILSVVEARAYREVTAERVIT